MTDAPDTTAADLLRRTLDAQGMSQVELAEATGLSTKHVNQILQGDIGISAQCATLIGFHLGIPAEVWLTLQAVGDVQRALAEDAPRGEPVMPKLRRQRTEARAEAERLRKDVERVAAERDQARGLALQLACVVKCYAPIDVQAFHLTLLPDWLTLDAGPAPHAASGAKP